MGNIKIERKGEKVINFFKKYGYYLMAGILITSVTLAVLLTSLNSKVSLPINDDPPAIDTNVAALTFMLPLSECSVAMDFSMDKFIFNETLNWFETHAGVILTSESSNDVLAACSGTVTNIYSDDLEGTVITIQHDSEYSSIYASLDKNVNVKIGDNVNVGQKIGMTSNSRGTSSALGEHLYFELIKNGTEVNPNDYLNLGGK